MHYNPVRRGLVTRPDQWRWSSHNSFSLDPVVLRACPIAIDVIHLSDSYQSLGPARENAHGSQNCAHRGYLNFVEPN